MERKLVKSAIYTFISSLALMIVIFEQNPVVESDGLYTSQHIELVDYLFMVLRYSIKITFCVVVFILLSELYKKYK
jgi:hypothetical protein